MKTVGTYLTVENQENGCKLYMAPKMDIKIKSLNEDKLFQVQEIS